MLNLAPTTSDSMSPKPIDFGGLRATGTSQRGMLTDRQLFYRLLHIDEFPEVLPHANELATGWLAETHRRADELTDFDFPAGPADLDIYAQSVRDAALAERATLTEEFARVPVNQLRHQLRQFAPSALLDGCWLQQVSSAATSHESLSCGLLKLYSHEVGDGYPAQHHGNCYRDLLQSLGIYLPEISTVAFIEERDIRDEAFREPVFLLCISQFPQTFAPEIVGLALHYYLAGIAPLYLALQHRLQTLGASTRFLELHALGRQLDENAECILELARLCVQASEANGNVSPHACWQRIRDGYLSAQLAARDDRDRGLSYLRSPGVTPHERMLELIERKARHAFGYHSESQMAGKSLDAWMNPAELDPERFLSEFANSRYVKRGDAEGSLLLKKLVAFKGPMFRVFSPEELEVIREWINSLPKHDSPPIVPTGSSLSRPKTPVAVAISASDRSAAIHDAVKEYERASVAKYGKMPLGDVYYYLLNIERYPDARPFAKHFATEWLSLAGRKLHRGRRPIPFMPYSHEALDAWLDAQHSRQVASYTKKNGEPAQTREELIESTIQQAPMILIDGGWIQNAWGAGISHTEVGCKLFHIYVDEAGNGDPELNHPNIYRALLGQMGVDLPRFATLEFSRWPGFKPQAFRVPVFWLSISQFPSRFLSETLGLNLAMELSGVGGAYRDAIDALRFYGFDPTFVELHNTIDNVSTGHTAWASEAIKSHMDEMFSRGGAELVEQHWQRVWTGYRALVPPPRGLIQRIKRLF